MMDRPVTGERPYRVAYVIGELDKGGAEYQLHELLRGLDRRWFQPEVFVLATGGFWAGPIRELGVTVHELTRRGSGDVARLIRLRGALRRFAPHVLHTILWPGNTYGRLAAVRLGIPVVIAAERNVHVRPHWEVLVERLLDPTTDVYLVNSDAIVEQLVNGGGLPRRKMRVVYNGIDLTRLPAFELDRRGTRARLGFPPDRRLVAQVGRLAEQKDFPTFLRAAAQVAAEVADVDFLVVGQGELRGELEALTRELGIAERVRFTGVRHDVPALLGAVDVLALTSRFEGLPNVVIEAMAGGAVPVVTSVGGTPSLVTSGETGFFVPCGEPGATAEAILRVLREPELARRFAVAGRRRIETDFGIETMVQRTVTVYLQQLGAVGVGLQTPAAA